MGGVLPRPPAALAGALRHKMAAAAELGALGRRWLCWLCWLLGLQAVRAGADARG